VSRSRWYQSLDTEIGLVIIRRYDNNLNEIRYNLEGIVESAISEYYDRLYQYNVYITDGNTKILLTWESFRLSRIRIRNSYISVDGTQLFLENLTIRLLDPDQLVL
jgi:hypothetical protein